MDQTKNTENGFNTVEEALEDLRQGKLILVTEMCIRDRAKRPKRTARM